MPSGARSSTSSSTTSASSTRPFRSTTRASRSSSRSGAARTGRRRRTALRPTTVRGNLVRLAPLDGKRAIVTGASSGIGEATVRQLREAGARVAGGARRADRIEADIALELDVTDTASCESFVERAIGELGGLDVLVNSAGLALGRDPFWESTEGDERTVLETNVNGLIRMTRLCLPQLEDGGGHIVNLGSVAGIEVYENAALYCVSKAAVQVFSRALREDLLGKPIRVTTLAPGLVETEGFSLTRFRGDAEKAGAVYANVPFGGALQADDVADCILFAVTRPQHVNVDEIVLLATAQSSGARVYREQ
jgi:NADP-dependent 3-hydroxy acid dehydrogenase YdfG